MISCHQKKEKFRLQVNPPLNLWQNPDVQTSLYFAESQTLNMRLIKKKKQVNSTLISGVGHINGNDCGLQSGRG